MLLFSDKHSFEKCFMINFFGYHVRKFGIIKGIIDFLILFSGLFLYNIFGLASSGSTTPADISPFILSVVTALLTGGVLFALGLYDLPKTGRIRNMLARMVAVFVVIAPITMILWYSVGFDYQKSLFVPVFAIIIQLSLFVISRILYYKILPNGLSQERVLIVATPKETSEIKKIIQKSSQNIYIVKNIESDFIEKHPDFDLLSVCQKNNIDMIIIGHYKTAAALSMFASCRFAGFKMLDINLMREKYLGQVNIEKFYSYHLLFDKYFVIDKISAFIKRVFDIVVALSVLILTLPVTIIVSILIYLQDKHNVFYTQMRTGQGGKPFKIFKFRSMRIDAESNGQAVWASENDNRITKVGSFIRKTRIDEIPQCLNILFGDMSVVGPRPERPEFVKMLEKEIPLYNQRHHIKPGLTGWAQINEKYGASSDDARRKLEYDLYYLKHHSLVLDILILIRTLSVVIYPNGVR